MVVYCLKTTRLKSWYPYKTVGVILVHVVVIYSSEILMLGKSYNVGLYQFPLQESNIWQPTSIRKKNTKEVLWSKLLLSTPLPGSNIHHNKLLWYSIIFAIESTFYNKSILHLHIGNNFSKSSSWSHFCSWTHKTS